MIANDALRAWLAYDGLDKVNLQHDPISGGVGQGLRYTGESFQSGSVEPISEASLLKNLVESFVIFLLEAGVGAQSVCSHSSRPYPKFYPK